MPSILCVNMSSHIFRVWAKVYAAVVTAEGKAFPRNWRGEFNSYSRLRFRVERDDENQKSRNTILLRKGHSGRVAYQVFETNV